MKKNVKKELKYIKYATISITLLLFVGILLSVFLVKHEVAVERNNNFLPTNNNSAYESNIDDISKDNNSINISGWLIKRNYDIGVINRKVILRQKESDSFLSIPTEIIQRPDLNEYMDDGVNYSDSGFYATVLLSDLDLTSDYDIYILDNSDDDSVMVKISDSLKGELQK